MSTSGLARTVGVVLRFDRLNQTRSISNQSSQSAGKVNSTLSQQTIRRLKQQGIANAEASYDSLPPLTSGFDQLSITKPSSFLKPRVHLTSLPKIALKLTRPAKETEAYGVNFGVMARQPQLDSAQSESSPSSLIDQALESRRTPKNSTPETIIRADSISKTNKKNASFGSINDDPSCHKDSTDLLPVSHKKLQKLADLINQHRMTLDQAIVQMKFSHKAIASRVLDLLLKAKNNAIQRGFKPDRLIISEAWVTKGFHTAELQVRARGRHGKIHHPTAKFNIILRQSSDLSKLALKKRLELVASRRRLNQRGMIDGSSIRLPGDGVVPTSVSQRSHWGW